MKPNERLKMVLAYLKSQGFGETNKDLMAKLGYRNESSFSQVIGGKAAISNPMQEKLKLLAPEINLAWLMEGTGEMIISDGLTAMAEDEYQWVEIVDLKTAAGHIGAENVAELPSHKKMLVPKEYEAGNYLVTRVEGRSMEDGVYSIHEGSHILIKEMDCHLENHQLNLIDNLYVIVSRNGTVLKQIVEQNMEHGYLKCHSYNPEYKDYKIFFDDVLQIFNYRKVVSARPPIPQIPQTLQA